jgi:hypothetical protein
MDDVDCPSQQNDEVLADVLGDYVIEEKYYRLERKTQRFVRRGGRLAEVVLTLVRSGIKALCRVALVMEG